MTETATEPPVLGLDRSQTQTYVQAAMALGWMLRERRQERGKRAWSEAEDATRAHDELEDLLRTPPVRGLTTSERRETTSWVDSRSVTDAEGREELRVRIRPTGGDRWILAAEIVPLQPLSDPDDRVQVEISCDTEARARDLADELAAAGPDRGLLARLGGHTQRVEQRRRAARDEVAPDRQLWLEQLTEAAHEAWPSEVAERVVDSEAFGALARHVRTLADRGYEPLDTLTRIKGADLARADDPGALAAWFAKKLTQQLIVVDGEAAQEGPRLRDVPRAGADLAAAETVVRRVAPDLADQLVACPAWPTLAKAIHEAAEAGQPIERMLAGVSPQMFAEARKPAAYATHLLRRLQDDAQAAAASRAERPWPPSPRPRTGPAADNSPTDLDPTSAVDRALLDTENRTAGQDDPAAAAAHSEAAQNAEAAAYSAELAAGQHAEAGGDAGRRGDEGMARQDDNLAAGQLAAAADEHSAAAAALRASVPFTPAQPGNRPPAVRKNAQSTPPRAPLPVQTPVQQQRGRHR